MNLIITISASVNLLITAAIFGIYVMEEEHSLSIMIVVLLLITPMLVTSLSSLGVI